jgi:hypothetical protein
MFRFLHSFQATFLRQVPYVQTLTQPRLELKDTYWRVRPNWSLNDRSAPMMGTAVFGDDTGAASGVLGTFSCAGRS